jgi:hypothetical protein
MNENNKEIIIKIEEGIQTKAFKPENIIHKDAYERIKKLIKQNLEKAEEYRNKLENKDIKEVFERVHNTITINGERGAGKTSFMLSIKYAVENTNDIDKNHEIEVLDILDPTMISTRQHVFVLLLAMIEKRINEKFNSKCREKKFDDSYKNWKESLEKLAKGLNQLDGIGNNPYYNDLWDDSTLIIAKGLDLAKAGIDLEKRFHIFVNKSLKLLEKKVFLLFIDDIDTDFSKGWEVLEILRKYITTPQIIPIMAGNFELYENLVRKEKSKLFKELIEFEKNFDNFNNKKMLYNNQMDELTQQYLTKIMQPINMMNLHRLYIYLQINKYTFKIDNINFHFFMEKIYKKFFKRYYLNQYNASLLNLPLRSIFQWLYKAKKIDNLKNDKKEFIEYLKDLFILDLMKSFKGIDFDFFDNLKSEYNVDFFVRFLIKNDFQYVDIIKFEPGYTDNNKNISYIVLSQYFNTNTDLMQKIEWGIKGILFYWIKDKFIKDINYPEKNLSLIDIIKFYNQQKFSNKIHKLYYISINLYANRSKMKKNIDLIKNIIKLLILGKLKLKNSNFERLEKLVENNDFSEIVKILNLYIPNEKNKIKEDELKKYMEDITFNVKQSLGEEKIKYLKSKDIENNKYISSIKKFILIIILLDFAINKEKNKETFAKIISEIYLKVEQENIKTQIQQEKLIKEIFDNKENKKFLEIVIDIFIKFDLIKTLENINDNIYKRLPLLKYKQSITTKNLYYSFSFLKLLSLFNEILYIYFNNTLFNIEPIIKKYINENTILVIGNNEITEDEETIDEENEIITNEFEQEIRILSKQIKKWLENNKTIINNLFECHLFDINEIFKDFYEVFDEKAKHSNLINSSMYIKVCLYSLLNSYVKLILNNSIKNIPDIYKFDQLDYLDKNIEKIENKKDQDFIKKLKQFITESPIFKPYIEEGNEFEKILIHYEQRVK